MKINHIRAVCFSPTGKTKKVTHELASAIAERPTMNYFLLVVPDYAQRI